MDASCSSNPRTVSWPRSRQSSRTSSMTLILRTWSCLNPRCRKIFQSWEKSNPACDKCGCVKVSWVPGGGHIGKVAKAADATLRSAADSFGLTNLNSPSASRLNRAQPKLEQPPVDDSIGVKHFAPGFSAAISRGWDGRGGATCGPSESGVNAHGRVTIGAQLASGAYPGVQRDFG